MLGRGKRASPQFISIRDGSWFGTSACIDLNTTISSALCATVGNSSLISKPLRPCFLNENGDANKVPVLRSVLRFPDGNGFP